jgi:hypothetical protein
MAVKIALAGKGWFRRYPDAGTGALRGNDVTLRNGGHAAHRRSAAPFISGCSSTMRSERVFWTPFLLQDQDFPGRAPRS